MKKVDLTGVRFGKLTVVCDSGRDKHGRVMWECLCDCGDQIKAQSGNLRNGNTTSCGCNKNKPSKRRLDLTGLRVGRLEVVKHSHVKSSISYWECLCDCGNECVVTTSRLSRSKTKSCGCLQAENRFAVNKPLGPAKWARTVKSIQPCCAKCDSTNELHAHHILPESKYPSLKRDYSNGITLCKNCHFEFHNIYGKNKCTVEDLCYFLGFNDLEKSLFVNFIGWRKKNGLADLEKAKHYIELLIQLEKGDDNEQD